ncbi:MAG: DedA family protein [Acetobacteraceae bacterium]
MSVSQILAFALAHPVMQAFAIIFATFVLEDAATVLAALQAASGVLSIPLALGSLYVGIVLGDMGLYGFGRLAALAPWVRRFLPPQRTEIARAWLQGHVFRVVVISRFLPGVRLPTYLTCGFLGAGFKWFAFGSICATLVWTSGLFFISMRVGGFIMAHFGIWRWAGLIGLVLGVVVGGWIARTIGRRHNRPPPPRSRRHPHRPYRDAPQQ